MAKVYGTEAEVFGALRKRFPAPEFATLPGVRDGTGWNSQRTIDALVMGLWPSRGLLLHGVEIKVSRGDWLRELRNPKKQETIFKRCDRFWLAVGDPDIVQPGELPETWGLLVPHRGATLKIKKQAPELTPAPLDRAFLAAILRRADENMRDPETEARVRLELQAEYDANLARVKEAMELSHSGLVTGLKEKLLQAERFEEKAGIRFHAYSRLDEVAELVRLTNRLGHAHFMVRMRSQLEAVRSQAQALVSQADGGLDALDKLQATQDESETEPCPNP
jgi:hypothetical protein